MNTFGITNLALKMFIAYLYFIYLSVAGVTINIFVTFYKKIEIYNYRKQCLP